MRDGNEFAQMSLNLKTTDKIFLPSFSSFFFFFLFCVKSARSKIWKENKNDLVREMKLYGKNSLKVKS